MELALGNSLTVLVVDHDLQVRTFIERSLRLTGASAILCASSFEGLHAIEHANLVMLDLVMPDQDSYEFLHRCEKQVTGPVPATLPSSLWDGIVYRRERIFTMPG